MNSKLPIVLAVLLAAAGCSRKLSPERAPEAQPAYTFPHATHVDADVKCTACHAGIEKATKLEAGVRHIAIPAGASKQAPCSDCHDKDPQAKLAARTAPPRFTFSHADHLAKVNGDCRKCHRELTELQRDWPSGLHFDERVEVGFDDIRSLRKQRNPL